MIVVPWSLEPNEDETIGRSTSSITISPGKTEQLTAPAETVSCVIFVESRVRVLFGKGDALEHGIPLDQGDHQFPIAGGGDLFVAVPREEPEARVSVLWLKYRGKPGTATA